jgi:hypothetical protein
VSLPHPGLGGGMWGVCAVGAFAAATEPRCRLPWLLPSRRLTRCGWSSPAPRLRPPSTARCRWKGTAVPHTTLGTNGVPWHRANCLRGRLRSENARVDPRATSLLLHTDSTYTLYY